MSDVALRDCGRWLSGGTPSTENPSYWGGNIPWITSSSLKGRYLDRSQRQLTEEGVVAGSRLVPPGTLIFVVRGMSLKSEFRVGVSTRPLAFGQDCKALVPAEGIDSKYLLFALEAAEDRVLRMVDEASHGTGRLQTSLLGALRVRMPQLEEQRRIAEVLDTIDETIQATEGIIAKLSYLMNGLVADQLRLADDGRRVSLAKVAEISGGLALSAARAVPDAVELPYLRVANVQDGYINTSTMRTVLVSRGDVDRYAVRRGDVLMNEGGDFDKLGRGAVWDGRIDPCLHQNHVFRVRCVPDLLVPEFLALFCQSHEAKSYFINNSKQTTNLASINKTQIGALPTLVPDLARQRQAVSLVEALQSRINSEASEASALRALRAGVASDLLSGRVRTVAV